MRSLGVKPPIIKLARAVPTAHTQRGARSLYCLYLTLWWAGDSVEKQMAKGLTPTSLTDYPGLQEGNLATVRFH